jgi:hypothetical protein
MRILKEQKGTPDVAKSVCNLREASFEAVSDLWLEGV